jgi:SAM-dependent methyltransferase
MSSTTKAVTYALDHTDEERRRLMDQDQLFRAHFEHLLRACGVGAGMRVLDIGCGVGDVSLLAATFVGPAGEVVGVDRDSRSLQLARQRAAEQRLDNVCFVEAELDSMALSGRFDVLLGRFVLMYLGDVVDTVKRLSRLVGPGGTVAFQEYWMDHPVLGFPEPVEEWKRAVGQVVDTFDRVGVDVHLGPKLPGIFTAAGLPTPELHMAVPFFGAASDLTLRVAAQTLRNITPLAEKTGVATAQEIDADNAVDRLRAAFAQNKAVGSWPPLVSAWTRVQ